jgi:polyisoprenoid-binding protein YceI
MPCLLGLALLSLPLLAGAQASRELHFQPQQSRAEFRVRLVWFQTVTGQFDDVQGGVRIDPADHTARVQARIRVRSVRLHPAHYRERLLGPHFFDAERYPYIRFQSSVIDMHELRNGKHLHGRLTMHGITRPLTLQLSDSDCSGPGLAHCTLRLKGWLDRTRFDMRAYRAFLHRRVRLDLVIRLQSDAPTPATSTQPDASG